ncbi:mitochondrial carrier homolog 2 [Eurytemora carolleeae]|uniref:mitochondrial carrier homolog 2 n=1 Tax=Eurytemora carolleeae TaxID=1294199 RepID=UPI000C7659C2|nr:mitochondrial carrier homolog 2 [Eurytemora carolleeae]|eukprot:XP_023319500.1 mitochondrial carrier homolog 2-like [Eurytemora affinis]
MFQIAMEKLEIPQEIPVGLAFKLGMSVLAHPLEVSKVLIQLGHEPVAPRATRTLLGKPALSLPSVFQYCGYIRRREGWSGLFRGITPRISSIALQSFTAAKFDEMVPPEAELSEEDTSKLTDEEKLHRFLKATLRDMANKTVCVIVSQPLQVLTVRAIAEFVGGEHKYSSDISGGIFSGIMSTVQDNGIFGLWSGVMPRLIGEVSLVAVSASITFLINTYLLKDTEMKKFTSNFSNYIAQSLTYPFQVVGNCMVVSRSGLAAGYPPFMPMYISWTDCFSHLKSQTQLKRGSSLFFRYYTGPQVLVGDRIMPVSSNMLKPPK